MRPALTIPPAPVRGPGACRRVGGAFVAGTRRRPTGGNTLRSDPRALSPIGGVAGVVLVIVGIGLLVSTGAFAYFSIPGFINSTFGVYALLNGLGVTSIIAGIVIALAL